MKIVPLILLIFFSSCGFSQTPAVPFPTALEVAGIRQKPMTAEIPGSLILGNGDLNGILWVHEGNLRFSITKNDVCDGRLDTENDPDLCRIDIRNNKWSAPPLSGKPPSWDKPYPCPLICGHVEFSSGTTKSASADLGSRLDLARAVANVTGSDGRKLSLRVLAGRNAIVFETNDKVAVSPCAAQFIPGSKRGVQDGIEWVLTTVPGDTDWQGMSFALAHGILASRHVVAVVTSFEAKDPVAAAVKLARMLLDENELKQVAEHEGVWREFWSKSGVALADAYLESVWYRNLYFLRCCSKPGVPPIGLFMGCATDVMPWHGCATTDYNFEQCFWGAFATNHAELADSYNSYIVDYLPRGKWFAKETYGLDGAFYPVNQFTHQINDPLVCRSKNRHMNFYMPYTYVPGANGWQAQNVWQSYLYQPDRQFLEKKAYPVVREMALFYASFLEQCRKTAEGKAIYGPSYSPEHRSFGEFDTPCDIAWTRFTLKAAIQGAHTLGCDMNLIKQWEKALKLVPDYPLSSKSAATVIVDVRGGEPIKYNVPVPTLPVFPVGEVNWWSPEEEKALFSRTIETISTTRYNSVMMLAGAHARLSLPDTYEWITKAFRERQFPGGFLMLQGDGYGNDTRGNYSEQMAAAGIVSELLLQSIGDIIRVFPAWPKEKDAQFTNLRAQGGFLVTAEQKEGKVVRLEITSTVGGELCLLNPLTGKLFKCHTRPGDKTKIV